MPRETAERIEKDPFYKKWSTWTDEHLSPWGLHLTSSYDPTKDEVTYKVVDSQKYRARNASLFDFGVLVKMRVPLNEEISEERLQANLDIMGGEFDRANAMQQGSAMAFSLCHLNVTVSLQRRNSIEDPSKYLAQLEERYTNLFMGWLDENHTS